MALETITMYTPEYEQIKEITQKNFGTVPWKKGVQDGEQLFVELDILHDYLGIFDDEARAKDDYKEAATALDRAVLDKYPDLTEDEIKTLVVENKWTAAIEEAVRSEIEGVAQTVAGRVKALEECYAEPLPSLEAKAETLAQEVERHLREMGLSWSAHA